MLKVLGDAYVAAGTGQVTLLSLLDLSAAFDTVDHPILVERLRRSFGVAGRALDWILSYLTGRSQFVRFNGTASCITPVVCGVYTAGVRSWPNSVQCSCYTPLVSCSFINCGLSAHAYADDFQVYTVTSTQPSQRR